MHRLVSLFFLLGLSVSGATYQINGHNTSASTLYWSVARVSGGTTNWLLSIIGINAGQTDTRYNLGGTGNWLVKWQNGALATIKWDWSPAIYDGINWTTTCNGTASNQHTNSTRCVSVTNLDNLLGCRATVYAAVNGGAAAAVAGKVNLLIGWKDSRELCDTLTDGNVFTQYYAVMDCAGDNSTVVQGSGSDIQEDDPNPGNSSSDNDTPGGSGSDTFDNGSTNPTKNDDALLKGMSELLDELRKKFNEATGRGLTNLVAVGNSTLTDIKNKLPGNMATNRVATADASEATLQGFTNQTGMRLGALTNQVGYLTNQVGVGSSSNYAVGWSVTNSQNWSSSSNSAIAALGGAETNFDSALSRMGSAPQFNGSGSSNALAFAFCGTVLNVNPEVIMPGLTSIIYNAWVFILLAGFALWAGHLMFEASKTFAAAETGGVPNLEGSFFGFGGNVIGVAVAILVPLALLFVWRFIFNRLFGDLFGSMDSLGTAKGLLGFGGNQLFQWFITNLFPLNLALSLLFTQITLYFTAGKVVLVAAAASRWLWGK